MTKRVYELVAGDYFMYYCVVNKVVRVKDGRIVFSPVSYAGKSPRESFSVKNQMKVEMVDPKTIYYGKDKQ